MLEIIEFTCESQEYTAALKLRTEILRAPLGLKFSPEDLAQESEQIHLGGKLAGQLVACLSLVPLAGGQIKMRQVAIAADLQGRGLGRELVLAAEALARKRGYTRMVLHARESAVRFYQALGYALEGEPFIEVTIPHRYMCKELG